MMNNAIIRNECNDKLNQTMDDMRQGLQNAEMKQDLESKSEINGWFHRAKQALGDGGGANANMKTGVLFTTTVFLCSAAAVLVTKSKRG